MWRHTLFFSIRRPSLCLEAIANYCLDNVEPGFILLFVVQGFIVTVEDKLLVFDADLGTLFHRFRDKGVTANHNAVLDDGVTAKDGGSGVDRDVVTDGGVASDVAQLLATLGGEGS